MDVVPYITKIRTAISNSAGEEFARSATGKYMVRGKYLEKSNGAWAERTETIKLYGFNLVASNNAVTIKDTLLTPTAGGTDSYGSYLNLSIGTTTVSGDVSIKVNGYESLNNKNANPTFESPSDNTITSVPYNCQANGKTNDRLTDDVSLWIWDLGYFVDDTYIWTPMMKMDTNSNYYLSYGNGGTSMGVNKNGTFRSVDWSYNKFQNTNVAFDGLGNIYAVGTNIDRIDNSSAKFVFYTPYSSSMPDLVNSGDSSYVYSSDSKRHLESVYNNSTGVYDIERVQLPKMTSYTNGNKAYIGIAYFDNNNTINPVKVRFGSRETSYTEYATSRNFTWGSVTRYGTTYEGFTANTDYRNRYVLISGEYKKLVYVYDRNNTYYFTVDGYDSQTTFTSAVYTANVNITGGITGNTNGQNQSNNPNTSDGSASGYHIVASDSTTYQGGKYVSTGIVPASVAGTTNNVGVVAWYDASIRKIIYSYNEDPDTAVVGGVWQDNAVPLDVAYTGWYVDLAVDDAGGIHIAYYDSGKGDLKYAYISKYDEPENAQVVIVDSYLSVGTDITINTRYENGNYVPYIYYYNGSTTQTPNCVKVAWRTDMTTLRDGAIDDKFTGAWESMTIPANNIPVDATICGAVPTNGEYGDSVVLGYMSDAFYEKAYIKK